jgi:TPP-dependent pyruvate/acetoin dehydrogenase alpha subunit
MDVGVKRKDELKDWIPKDPNARARRLLLERGASVESLDTIVREAIEEVDCAVEFAKKSPYPSPETVTDHVFAASEEAARA